MNYLSVYIYERSLDENDIKKLPRELFNLTNLETL